MKNLINRVMSREQSMLNIKLASVLFLISLLAACGGGGGAIGETKPGFGQGESDGSGANPNPNSPQTLGSNTFFPLNFYYSGEGYVEKDEMDYFLFDPLTQAYLVSPVDSRTLKPASAPKLSDFRSEEHTSELQSRPHLVCRLLLEKKKEIVIVLLLLLMLV